MAENSTEQNTCHKVLTTAELLDHVSLLLTAKERSMLGRTGRSMQRVLAQGWEQADHAHICALSNALNDITDWQKASRLDDYRHAVRTLQLEPLAVDDAIGQVNMLINICKNTRGGQIFPHLRVLTLTCNHWMGMSAAVRCFSSTLRKLEVKLQEPDIQTRVRYKNAICVMFAMLPDNCPYLEELRIYKDDQNGFVQGLPSVAFLSRLSRLRRISLDWDFICSEALERLASSTIRHLEVLGQDGADTLGLVNAATRSQPEWEALEDIVIRGSARHANTLLLTLNATPTGLKLDLSGWDDSISRSLLAQTISLFAASVESLHLIIRGTANHPIDEPMDVGELLPLKNCKKMKDFSIEYDSRKPLTTMNASLLRLSSGWSDLERFRALWGRDAKTCRLMVSGVASFHITDIAEMTHTCPKLQIMELTSATFEEEMDWPEPAAEAHVLNLRLEDIVADETYLVVTMDLIWPGLDLHFTGSTPWVVTAAKKYIERIKEVKKRIEIRRCMRLERNV